MCQRITIKSKILIHVKFEKLKSLVKVAGFMIFIEIKLTILIKVLCSLADITSYIVIL